VAKDLETARTNLANTDKHIKDEAAQYEVVGKKIDRFQRILQNQDTVKAKVKEEEEKNQVPQHPGSGNKHYRPGDRRLTGRDRFHREGLRRQDRSRRQKSGSGRSNIRKLAPQEASINQRESDLGRKEEQLTHFISDASKLNGVACHPDFDPSYINKTCRFIKDAYLAKVNIPGFQAEIATERHRIDSDKAALRRRLGR